MHDELGSLAAFAAVAEARSFTRAAGRLGTSQSALSHKIRRLEGRLGIRLLTRTTRSVALTDAGSRLLETLAPALDDIKERLVALTGSETSPAGAVRISSADHAAETILWPALRTLLPRFPGISVEVNVDNGLVDIVADRFDAGIRLGGNLARDMIAVPIGPPERLTVVGSPDYLSANPAPINPADLRTHRCINRHLPTLGGLAPWEFSKNGSQERVRVTGQLAFNRPELIIEAALEGFGLACILASQVKPLVAEGRLISVLDDWCPEFPGYHLYYPSRRQHTLAFEIVRDALRYQPNS